MVGVSLAVRLRRPELRESTCSRIERTLATTKAASQITALGVTYAALNDGSEAAVCDHCKPLLPPALQIGHLSSVSAQSRRLERGGSNMSSISRNDVLATVRNAAANTSYVAWRLAK